jgi:hypothetical protein
MEDNALCTTDGLECSSVHKKKRSEVDVTTTDFGNRTAPEHLPGAALPRDIAAGEHVEHEIDAFISRRHRDRVATEGERQAEEHWKASERA